jgi:transcriptional regulator with XRE-family HTH domain
VNVVLERLKNELKDEDRRYAYADTVTDAFLTGQIKTLREERGLTQEGLAKLVGTKQSGISRWLNSGFSGCKVESLRKFAHAYGVRLRISFEPFSTLPDDVEGFTKERLAPPRFEDDPAFNENPVKQELNRAAAVAMAKSILKQQVTAGQGWTDAIADWQTRLSRAASIMELGKQFPQLFESLRGIHDPNTDNAIDPYKDLRPMPQPKTADTPANRTVSEAQPVDSIELRLDFESEEEKVAA